MITTKSLELRENLKSKEGESMIKRIGAFMMGTEGKSELALAR